MIFYVGLDQPSHAAHIQRCMISASRLRKRVSDFVVNEWMLDSGAFMELKIHGAYRDDPRVYAAQIRRWATVGNLVAASSQDYMCEPFILARTGLDVPTHQRLTIERYDAIRAEVGDAAYVLPVLQGFLPQQYQEHIAQYGNRLALGAWVGVGSVCKRNGSPREIAAVFRAIKQVRPDLRLHGFGCKTTALASTEVRQLLHTADSMAWSFAARMQGRNQHDWREAAAFAARIQQARPLAALPMEELWSR